MHYTIFYNNVTLLPVAGKPTGTVNTKGENINISWSPDGHTIAVGNKVTINIVIGR